MVVGHHGTDLEMNGLWSTFRGYIDTLTLGFQLWPFYLGLRCCEKDSGQFRESS